jgi:hypothetical protein
VDGGVPPAEAVQGVPHMARIAVWRLTDGKQLLRVRREGGGELLGGVRTSDGAVMAAARRQANSCALALSVREAIGDPNVPKVAPPQ